MDHTYLDLFNYYMKQFLNHVNANFPGTKQPIVANYRPLLEGRDEKSDRYAKMFLSVANSHIDAIVTRDASAMFADADKSNYSFVQGVDFRELWQSSHNTEDVQLSTWQFLQLLLRLSRSFIPSRDEVRSLLQEVSDGTIDAPAKLDATLYSTKSEEDDEDDGTVGAPDIFGLGKLAGLAGLAGIGNGEAPDLSQLMKMGAEMLGNMGIDENTVAQAASAMNGEQDVEVNANDSSGQVDEESVGETSDTNATTETKEETATTPNPLESMVNNPKIMGFVEKMKANMDASGIDENNPAAVFQHLAKSGFSQDTMPELLEVSKEVLGGLGGAGGLGGLLQGMMGGGGAGRKQRRNTERKSEAMVGRRGAPTTTRERLRARLEAKHAAEANVSVANKEAASDDK